MIPELLAVLQERKRVSLRELSVLCKQKEEVTEQIMEQLIRKNKAVKRTIECSGCRKDCTACSSRGDFIYYESL